MKKSKVILIPLLAVVLAAASAIAASTPPKKKKKKNWLQELSEKAAPSTKSESVAGVRGLQDVGDSKPNPAARDFAAIDWLENQEVGDDEVTVFIAEGQLK